MKIANVSATMNKIPLLDHGSVQYIEHWGSDERIIEAARMSVDGGFVSWDPYDGHPKGDAGLLAFLYNNKHMTPFEMAGMVIEVKAPIFVFREWHRHRTQSYNEMSARYTPLPNEYYIPTVERLMINAGGTNRQAGTVAGSAELTLDSAKDFQQALEEHCSSANVLYRTSLDSGVPKELARACLPVNWYSRMRCSVNLRNWLGFLTLRTHPAAQWEIRQFANAVGTIIKEQFPRTWELFELEREVK